MKNKQKEMSFYLFDWSIVAPNGTNLLDAAEKQKIRDLLA